MKRLSPFLHMVKCALLAVGTSVIVLTVSSASVPAIAPVEFSLPVPEKEANDWSTFVGVGTVLRYPPGWYGRAYKAQGGIRDSATYEFTWIDRQRIIAQIEMLEIVEPITGITAMESEMSYWRGDGERQGYLLEQVMVQGYPGWWIGTPEPQEMTELAGTVWANWGERVYRFQLRCRPDAREEGEWLLRQMLSTLEVTTVDWSRASGFLPALPAGAVHSEAATAPVKLAGVPYDRSAAYAYAEAYWNQQNNDDGCYLWYNDDGTLDCQQDPGDYGVDGAHFVNRAVHAGGRSIPNQPALEGIRVADLRDWLQADGWITVTTTQAQVGDVAIIGPFDNPCWAGLVVETGSDPVLATHSSELWAQASLLSCATGDQETYLHVEVEFTVYLPVVIRNYPPLPPPAKEWSGMHMGNRIYADWSSDMLAPFDPEEDGIWPDVVVVQSRQVFDVTRNDAPDCKISGVSVKNGNLYNYLRRAVQDGETRVIFRITPAPGNFEESILTDQPLAQSDILTRTLISTIGVRPGGWPQCGNDWRFRTVDDVGDEMLAIQRYILWIAPFGYQWQAFGFEPANEPNTEWYSYGTRPRLDEEDSWQDMDQYFANLYDYVHDNAGILPVRVLTPPMAQSAYAETHDIRSNVPGCGDPFRFCGYAEMSLTFNSTDPKNDGYSWHNYWIEGREEWQTCPNGQHVSMWFPDTMESNIQNDVRPAVITEVDLASPDQNMGNPLMDKDGRPDDTATSIRDFLRYEQMADSIAVWLLNDDTGHAEHMWHQAYTPTVGFRAWFTNWWYGDEIP